MRTVYKNVVANGNLTDLTCEDGKILSLEKTEEKGRDMGGLTARAGLFDIHFHGCVGEDTMGGGAAISKMAKILAARGITSFLPTTCTFPFADLAKVDATLLPYEKGEAKVRGLHLEGPFIAMSRKGAQNGDAVVAPDLALLDACPHCTLITVAPEAEGAEDFIRAAVARGVRVAQGHTDADYDLSVSAMRAGADSLTHTFNAMPAMLHRAPGPVGAALTEGGFVQVISDGFHLHPAMVLALYKMFGPERMMLISDAITATGLADGPCVSGGLPVTVKDGQARLSDGTIAGSTTYLDDVVRRAISFGIPADDAFRMASETPARYMGLPCGVLKEGFDADFGFYDGEHRLVSVVINGEPLN
ncbi:MAG: N-acetylglucosamine-6-phosphate deacetylase [Clostridia bacterium]|nr:N-acetylglucosamine-6-phosphate deacetylase [Clostridia bacterium]